MGVFAISRCQQAIAVRPLRAIRASLRQLLLCVLFVLIEVSCSLPGTTYAQPGTNAVYIVQIHDIIDLGIAPYLARVLDEASQHGAQAVILEINTPGGRLDAALQMRDAILATPVRTIAYVNREAFSAGALIALAANHHCRDNIAGMPLKSCTDCRCTLLF